MGTNELTKTARELKELKILEAELKNEIKALEDTLKAEMTARNTQEMNIDIFTLRYKPVATTRFDSKALKIANLEMYNTFTKVTESMRFTIQ